jgi:hypothetical protein
MKLICRNGASSGMHLDNDPLNTTNNGFGGFYSYYDISGPLTSSRTYDVTIGSGGKPLTSCYRRDDGV